MSRPAEDREALRVPDSDLKHSVVAGALSARADGGPVRLRRNGRQRRPVGLYFSVKAGRHLPHESSLELHDLWRAEVDPDVVGIRPQPFTLNLAAGGLRWRYTPDRLDILSDGRERVVEIKPDGWETADPELGARLQGVAAMLERSGRIFEVRTQSRIEAQPSFSAVAAIQRLRRTRVGAGELARVQQCLGGRRRGLAEVEAVLGGGPAALAVISALVVRRIVRLDYSAGLHPHARVSLAG